MSPLLLFMWNLIDILGSKLFSYVSCFIGNHLNCICVWSLYEKKYLARSLKISLLPWWLFPISQWNLHFFLPTVYFCLFVSFVYFSPLTQSVEFWIFFSNSASTWLIVSLAVSHLLLYVSMKILTLVVIAISFRACIWVPLIWLVTFSGFHHIPDEMYKLVFWFFDL